MYLDQKLDTNLILTIWVWSEETVVVSRMSIVCPESERPVIRRSMSCSETKEDRHKNLSKLIQAISAFFFLVYAGPRAQCYKTFSVRNL